MIYPTIPQSPVLTFERHECKYLISEATARAVYRRVSPFVEPDPYAARSADHSYSICSLYLDTPSYRLLRETNDGIASRYKLRIRSYSDDPNVPIFPEIKARRGRIVTKLRSRIARADLPAFLDTLALNCEGRPNGVEDRARAEFRSRQHAIGAIPVVQVGYRRQAYVGRGDPGIRVTFDRDIRTCTGDQGQLTLPRPGWDVVEGRRVVLELKFNDHAPSWIGETVRALQLQLTSFSKYANCVEACESSLRWTALGRA